MRGELAAVGIEVVQQRRGAVIRSRQARVKPASACPLGVVTSCGAEPYLGAVDAELAGAGLARPQRHRSSPLDLAPREHDVATLAGRGLTNKEIAADPLISAKAVEYHLGNIFGKLGINSRRKLRDLVAT
jgi:DNA-binding CsgD family transcriptional regulator